MAHRQLKLKVKRNPRVPVGQTVTFSDPLALVDYIIADGNNKLFLSLMDSAVRGERLPKRYVLQTLARLRSAGIAVNDDPALALDITRFAIIKLRALVALRDREGG